MKQDARAQYVNTLHTLINELHVHLRNENTPDNINILHEILNALIDVEVLFERLQ